MVQSSQSQPGQFAAAIKKADPRSQVAAGLIPAPDRGDIDHGHGDETPEKPPYPEWLLGPQPAKDTDGSAGRAG
jgi:hypothetical protein